MTSSARPSPGLLRIVLGVTMSLIALLKHPLERVMEVLGWLRLRHVWLKPRPDDIYVVTLPKAGTTWMQQIVYQLLTQGQGEFEHILQVSPYLEQLTFKPRAEFLLDQLRSPRILKTHLRYSELRPPKQCRILYVTRDASDTLLSRFHHECLMRGVRIDFDQFFQQTLRSEDWARHLESWWPHRDDPNVLHVRYEDLVRDCAGSVRRIAAFLGVTLQEEHLPLILEKTSFDYMKRHDLRFDPRINIYEPGTAATGFIRKGGVGGGRTALKAEQRAALEAQVESTRRKLGIPGDAL